jgi:hypothetical protein
MLWRSAAWHAPARAYPARRPAHRPASRPAPARRPPRAQGAGYAAEPGGCYCPAGEPTWRNPGGMVTVALAMLAAVGFSHRTSVTDVYLVLARRLAAVAPWPARR